jgi:hypothetical protein
MHVLLGGLGLGRDDGQAEAFGTAVSPHSILWVVLGKPALCMVPWSHRTELKASAHFQPTVGTQ